MLIEKLIELHEELSYKEYELLLKVKIGFLRKKYY